MHIKIALSFLLAIASLTACSKKMTADAANASDTEIDANVTTDPAPNAEDILDPNLPGSGEKTAAGLDCFDKTRAQPSMVCDDDRRPVCGCNGKTYKNACEAGKAGVIHYKWGPCSKTTKTAVQ